MPERSPSKLRRNRRTAGPCWKTRPDAGATLELQVRGGQFHAAFGLGAQETAIATVDADGVALAAIQGLNEVVKEKEAKISSLEKRLSDLEAVVKSLAEKDGRR